MINRILCTVVFPLYKNISFLTENELFSLKNNIQKLKKWPQTLIGPENINWQEYRDLYSGFGSDFKIEIFNNRYFKNIAGYNDLLTSIGFFARFKKHRYLLICQLDAFVFKDELAYWCSKNYDYIGAPWFEGWTSGTSTNIIGIGNGGFSLRNVNTSLKILRRINDLKRMKFFWMKISLHRLISFKDFIKKIPFYGSYSGKDISMVLQVNSINEDGFWAIIVPSIFTNYKLSPTKEAIKFSFEVNPSFLYKENNNQLPFGCHAWEKFEPQFWKKFIN